MASRCNLYTFDYGHSFDLVALRKWQNLAACFPFAIAWWQAAYD
jgi:hypothetical protein